MASSTPKASFMGIPIELGLHIYELLPTHPASEAVAPWHCCSRHGHSRRRGCNCAIGNNARTTSILAVNKQIFDEAMPTLYGDLEILVETTWKELPDYAVKHVRQAAFLMRDENYRKDAGLERKFGYNEVISRVTMKHQTLREIRLHIDMFVFQEVRAEPHAGDVRILRNLLEFPDLRSIFLEFHIEYMVGPSRFREKRATLEVERRVNALSFIRTEAEKQGRAIAVEQTDCGVSRPFRKRAGPEV